jgi:hypothetical protein
MRLLTTSLATVGVLALTGTALANTHDEVNVTMGGTSHVRSGGQLHMSISRKPKGKYFHVVVQYHVTITSRTKLAFSAYPCKDTSCVNGSTTTQTSLAFTGGQTFSFTGRVPVVKTGGQECVFLQIRDRGPKGKAPGKIVRRHGHPGTRICRG